PELRGSCVIRSMIACISAPLPVLAAASRARPSATAEAFVSRRASSVSVFSRCRWDCQVAKAMTATTVASSGSSSRVPSRIPCRTLGTYPRTVPISRRTPSGPRPCRRRACRRRRHLPGDRTPLRGTGRAGEGGPRRRHRLRPTAPRGDAAAAPGRDRPAFEPGDSPPVPSRFGVRHAQRSTALARRKLGGLHPRDSLLNFRGVPMASGSWRRRCMGVALASLLCAVPAAAQDAPVAARTVTLREALELARATAPSMIAAQSAVDIAEANQLQTRGSLLPSLTANGSYSNSSNERFDQSTGRLVSQNYSAAL